MIPLRSLDFPHTGSDRTGVGTGIFPRKGTEARKRKRAMSLISRVGSRGLEWDLKGTCLPLSSSREGRDEWLFQRADRWGAGSPIRWLPVARICCLYLLSMDSQTVYLGLGSNLGDRASHLLQAVRGLLNHRLPVQALSPLYETDPVGYLDQPSFLNMVLAIDGTGWNPWRVLTVCQEIETSLGRRRSIPQGPRTIDLDLLFFGQQVVTGSRAGLDLVLPHPRLAERPFVLIPLSDLDPALLHPVLGKTVAQLLAAVSPQTSSSPTVSSAVRRYDPGEGLVGPGWQEPPFYQQN